MTINRATYPSEFYDRTSAGLLVAPEPQYLHAMLWKMAFATALDIGNGVGISPDRAVVGAGAPYPGPEGDRLMLADPIYAEAIRVVPEIGKGVGHTVRINRPAYTNSTYTLASREITGTISTTPVDLHGTQTDLTLKKYGGPYSSAVQPLAIDKLDATLSVHNLVDRVGRELKRDFDRTLDKFMIALFDATTNTVVRPGTQTADTDALVAGDSPFDCDVFFRAELALDEANIPYFANGRRVAVLHPRQINQLKSDTQFARYAQFHNAPDPTLNPLLSPAFFARLGKTDIFLSNTLTTAASTTTMYYGQMFGPGMVGSGVGRMPEVVTSTADNYGESALLIWIMYAAFATLDGSFGVRIATN